MWATRRKGSGVHKRMNMCVCQRAPSAVENEGARRRKQGRLHKNAASGGEQTAG